MGDAASNQPVLAPSDLGQSNLDAVTASGAAAAGGGGFIALDVSALSSLAGDVPDTAATAAPPRTPVSRQTRARRRRCVRFFRCFQSLILSSCDCAADATEGGEVAVEEGRKEAGRRRRQWHPRGRQEAPAVPALRPRGGFRRHERPPARPHAGGRHAGREVAAAAAGAVAGSPEGGLLLRHTVKRGNVDPALLHAVHEQDGRRRRRRWQRCSVRRWQLKAKKFFVLFSIQSLNVLRGGHDVATTIQASKG